MRNPADRIKSRRIRVVSMSLALSGLFFFGGAAHAQLEKKGTYKGQYGWHARGETFQLEADHHVFLGEFSGTFFNDAGSGFLHQMGGVCPGVNDIMKGENNGHGYCTFTDADGEKVFLKWQCRGQPECKGTFHWIGGTGKYTGISGNNEVSIFFSSGTSTGYSIVSGEWALP